MKTFHIVCLVVFFVGCGQGAPVPVQVVAPAGPKLLTAEDPDPQVKSWPNEVGVVYHWGRILLAKHLLEFPNDPAEWKNAKYDDSGLSTPRKSCYVWGTIISTLPSGAKVARKWEFMAHMGESDWVAEWVKLDDKQVMLDR